MKLFIFELKKLFRRRFLLIMLALLLCLNVFNIWQNYSLYFHNRNAEMNIARREMYEHIEGRLTSEKVQWIKDYNEKMTAIVNGGAAYDNYEFFTGYAFGDMNISNEWLDEVTRIYNYNSEIQRLKTETAEYKKFAAAHGSVYFQNVSDKIEKTYGERKIDSVYNYSAFEPYFSYSFSSFLIIIIMLLAFSPLFAGEYETGMQLCFMSSVNGRKATGFAKIGAMTVFTFIVCVLFSLADFITFCLCAGLDGFSAPIFAIAGFAYTPLTCSIASFIVLLFFVKLLGFLTLGLIYSFFSSVFHKSYSVFVFGLLATFGLMLVSAYSKGILDTINTVNPINLIIGYKMFSSFDVNIMNIFDLPFWKWSITIVFCLVFALLIFLTVIILNNKNARRHIK